jgi:DNA-binding MarR family transcriptional regulator
MSKKPDKSSRKADLPDWADEVTPADEVMEKFYAPTGRFRSGPISILKESAETLPSPQVEFVNDRPEPQPPAEQDLNTQNTSHISAEDPPPQESTFNFSSEIRAIVLPSPAIPEKPPEIPAPTPPPKSENTVIPQVNGSAEITPTDSQTLLFSEFAGRWKRYLYPGQLAIMRALYDLTVAQGTSECFTRYSELAAATKMSRRNCIHVMNSLIDRGFVERLEIRNDATSKGIRLRVHFDPLR